MATIEKSAQFPDVMSAYGADVYGDGVDPRLQLRKAVAAATGLPVKAGSHHTWAIFVAGAPDAGADNAHTSAATHGEIRIGFPGVGSIINDVSTVVHEMGHGWLVPNPLQFNVGGKIVDADRRDWIENNANRPYSGPLLIGRECSHWGGYFWAEHSPMDGLTFQRLPQEDGFDRWQQVTNTLLRVNAPNLPTIDINWNKFNDLDLAIMGLIDPARAYADLQGRVSWIEPKLTAPLGFRAGIFVALRIGMTLLDSPHTRIANDFLFFGLSHDHRRLAIERSDGTVIREVTLGAGYHPLAIGNNGVALRCVRRGNELRFQARLDGSTIPRGGFGDAPTGGFVGDYPSVPGLFDDLESTAQGLDFTHWQTVATVTEPRSPAFIGLEAAQVAGAMKFGFVEAIYFTLETITAALGHAVHRFNSVPALHPDWRNIEPGVPVTHAPPRGPVLQSSRGRLLMRLPVDLPNREDANPCYGDLDPGETPPPYDHGPFRDRSPKVILASPHGDFAFGTAVRVHRTLYQRSSGGAVNSIICGHERSVPAANLVVTDPMRAQNIGDSSCRVAYFIVARSQSDITLAMLEHVDQVRRYVDAAFLAATGGRMGVSSALSWPA